MIKQERQEGGRFAPKSDEPREVRSIRLTDKAWNILGEVADSRSITRADLMEELVEQGFFEGMKQPPNGELLLSLSQKEEEILCLNREVERLKKENSQLKPYFLPDLENLRDQVLFALKIGKQSPLYKKHKKALDEFIKKLMSNFT